MHISLDAIAHEVKEHKFRGFLVSRLRFGIENSLKIILIKSIFQFNIEFLIWIMHCLGMHDGVLSPNWNNKLAD